MSFMSSSSEASGVNAPAPRPVILVTGANAGVGFGICERLLFQFSDPTPTDTLGMVPSLVEDPTQEPMPSPFAAPNGITLVMCCRNAIKADKARRKLQNILDHLALLPDNVPTPLEIPSYFHEPVDVEVRATDDNVPLSTLHSAAQSSLRRRKQRSADVINGANGDEDEKESAGLLTIVKGDVRARGRYRRRFCQKSVIEVQPLDLGSMASVLKSAEEIRERYGYVTHAILNAGLAAWQGLNWPKAIWMICTGFRSAVTWPKYKKQRCGDIGADGYGWVWQCNVAAHYVFVRALLPAFRATPFSEPSRIVWTGSIEAYQRFYHPEDYQCLDPKISGPTYESTKYQCELVALGLDERLQVERVRTVPSTPAWEMPPPRLQSSTSKEPRSFLSHPGVVASSMFEDYLGTFLVLCFKLALYFARWMLSPHHLISGYKAGIAAVHLATAPASQLDTTVRYAARCDFWGQEYVYSSRVDGWAEDDAATKAGKEVNSKFGLPTGGAVETEATVQNEDAGEQVMQLSRDLLKRLEKIASDVWKKAGSGELPPFANLRD